MPFNEESPYIGPDGLPNLKPYGKAMLRALNGLINPTGDGDPPTAFYGTADFWLKTDLQPTLDSLAVQPAYPFQFFFRGDVEVALSPARHLVEDWHCEYALVKAGTAPTTSSVTLNFEYKGDLVLSSALTLDPGELGPKYATAFDLPDLVAAGLDLYRPLTARCVTSDSGDTAADIEFTLVCSRIAP